MITESLFKNIEKGKEGLNKGLSTGLSKLDNVIFGIQRGWLQVIFADSGAGKSTFTNYIGIYQPYKQYLESGKQLNVHFLLFSFEMSAEVVFAKLLSLHLFEKYNKILSYEQILSLREPLSDSDFKLIQQEIDWLKGLEELCTVIEKAQNAKGVCGITKEGRDQFGKYVPRGEHGEDYIPNDPQQYLIVLLDHVSLLKNNGKVKEEIDQVSTYLIHLRNKCNLTVFLVQQANRNLKAKDRKETEEGLNLSDLRDSSDTSNAAELVIGIYNPFREHLNKFKGYDIRRLQDRARCIQILKSRFGMSDLYIGTAFFGEVGLFRELPKPDQIIDYEPLTKL